MSYQRVLWHSGLTYRAVCPNCRFYTTYTDYNLGFRAWFPDGFVYCSHCRRPIRHHENNAINPDGTPYFPFPIRTPPPPGYVAYPIESLRLTAPVEPTPYAQQPYAQPVQQPYAQPVQQPYAQPYAQPMQQPYAQPVQQPYAPPEQQPEPPQAEQPEPQPAEAQVDAPDADEQKSVCPNCGREYTAGNDFFCSGCGTKLSD